MLLPPFHDKGGITMYHLIGQIAVLENLVLTAMPYADAGGINDCPSLKCSYKRMLHDLQPNVPVTGGLLPEFIQNRETIEKIAAIFNMIGNLNDISNEIIERETVIAQRETIGAVEAQYNRLKVRNPELGDLYDIAINGIFSSPSSMAGGGTTSSAIGLLWCNPRREWSDDDFFEFFVHEATHTLMFIDERRYQHYWNLADVVQSENYYPSAILSKKRPIDKVVHSIVVATEVLLHRERQLGHPESPRVHPPTTILLPKVQNSIESLLSSEGARALLTPRAIKLLTKCRNACAEIGSSQCGKSAAAA
jgi:hypothetical protein